MGAFEDFVNLELPRRSAVLTFDNTGYDGNPNDGGAPAIIQGAPLGTWFHWLGIDTFFRKNAAGTWEVGGGGGGGEIAPVRQFDLPIPKILVDPVNGDDSDLNPGTATPVKTITAALERVPIVSPYGIDDAQAGSVVTQVPVIRLLAGTYNYPELPGSPPYDYSKIFYGGASVPYLAIEGEYTEIGSSFLVDASSGAHVSQPAGNPAWTVDEHVGRFLRIASVYGLVTYYSYYPIIENDGYNLYLAPNYGSIPGAGANAQIVEHASIIHPGYGWNFTGYTQYRHLMFQASGSDYSAINLIGINSIQNCRFSGGFLSNTVGSRLETFTSMYGCLFDNDNYPTWFAQGGYRAIGNNAFVNISRCLEFGGNLESYGNAYRNCGDVYFCRPGARLFLRDGTIFKRGSMTHFIYQASSNPGSVVFGQPAQAILADHADSTSPPTYIVEIGKGNRCFVGSITSGGNIRVGTVTVQQAEFNGPEIDGHLEYETAVLSTK